MIKCETCGHDNLPSYPTCSKCGAPIGSAAAGDPSGRRSPHFAPTGAYQALVSQSVAVQRRPRMVYALLVLGALGGLTFLYLGDARRKGAVQAKLDFFDRWTTLEKKETGDFWNCTMAAEVDVNHFTSGAQFQAQMEAAYATQPKTYAQHLSEECQPKLEAARQAFASLSDVPDEFKAPLDAYRAALPKLGSGLDAYIERLKGRSGQKDVDALVQEYGNAWHAGGGATPEAVAYEKFLHCAIPNLAGMKDTQAMLQFLADTCYGKGKETAVAFMDRVRKDCGPILQTLDSKGKPSKTWALSRKRFLEDESRDLQAWEGCAKKARRGKKTEDLEPFLTGVVDYMKARGEVAQAARALR